MLGTKQKEATINDIIDALGTRLKFSCEAKRAFAEAIVGDAPIAARLGSTKHEVALNLEDFKNHVRQVLDSSAYIAKYIENSFEGTVIHSEAASSIKKEYRRYFHPGIMFGYVQALDKALNNRRAPTISRGPNNNAAKALALLIAKQYALKLGKLPTTKNGQITTSATGNDGKALSPYDRVCNYVAKHIGVKIAESTRSWAVKEVRGLNLMGG